VDLYEILFGGDGIEYYLDYVLFNPVVSTVPNWRMFKLLRWVLLLNRLVDLDEILYEGDLDSILLNLVASNHSKMDVKTSEVGSTFEPIGGFG
jgi:hypothetical protein